MKILTFLTFLVLFFQKVLFVKATTSSFGSNAIFGLIQRSIAFKWYIIHGYRGSINNKKIKKTEQFTVERISRGRLNRRPGSTVTIWLAFQKRP